MWVSFIADFDWEPTKVRTIAYKRGMRLLVTQACGSAAISAGSAVRERTPRKADAEAFEIRYPEADHAGG